MKFRDGFESSEMPTHYWMRGKDKNVVGLWSIVAVDQSNIHIINDPEHFGYEIHPIPRFPRKEFIRGLEHAIDQARLMKWDVQDPDEEKKVLNDTMDEFIAKIIETKNIQEQSQK